MDNKEKEIEELQGIAKQLTDTSRSFVIGSARAAQVGESDP